MKYTRFARETLGPSVERERQAQELKLRLASPNRPAVGQHDTSELDLFRTANEPRLI